MKDELIQISGKAYQKCEVIMLPTKEQRWKVGNQHDDRYESYSFVDKKLYSRQSNAHNWSLSHLYILSSKEIKEGDWYMYCHFGEWIISNSRETLKKGTNTLENLNKDDYFKKIIATTDKSLEIPCQVECHDCNGKGEQIIPYQDKGYICSRCLGTGLEDNEKPLPRPSDDFIKAFVKAQGKIDKVLVEYIFKNGIYSHKDCMECGGTGGYKNDCYECKGYGSHMTIVKEPVNELKIAPDNTITIKPVVRENKLLSHLAPELTKYIKLKKNQDECMGFSDGFERACELYLKIIEENL